ncbi:hypothetical protein EFR34_06045 [Lactobacillus delbrueckii subsp. lactis]|nr:hypothetical protein [Lactobacillus delbrueckii subsp. lactis]
MISASLFLLNQQFKIAAFYTFTFFHKSAFQCSKQIIELFFIKKLTYVNFDNFFGKKAVFRKLICNFAKKQVFFEFC